MFDSLPHFVFFFFSVLSDTNRFALELLLTLQFLTCAAEEQEVDGHGKRILGWRSMVLLAVFKRETSENQNSNTDHSAASTKEVTNLKTAKGKESFPAGQLIQEDHAVL